MMASSLLFGNSKHHVSCSFKCTRVSSKTPTSGTGTSYGYVEATNSRARAPFRAPFRARARAPFRARDGVSSRSLLCVVSATSQSCESPSGSGSGPQACRSKAQSAVDNDVGNTLKGQGVQGTSPASPSSRQFSGHSGQASVSLKSSKRTRLVHDDDSRVILKGLSMSELTYVLKNVAQVAQPARIAQRLFSAMYDVRAYIYRRKKQNAMPGLVASWDELEGHINAKTLDKLRRTCTLAGLVTLEDVQTSKDGTAKLVLRLDAAGKGASREELMAAGSTVEAVIIPDGAKRNTLCVSSQSGCGLNCQFCATGRLGFRGNLNACQVLEQMVIAARHVADHHADGQHNMLTNVVYMGMGEPLANLEAVKSSLEVLCEESVATFTIHANKITVSTSGLVPELNELMETTRAQLAVSLHATEDETRDWMVPVNRKYQLDELIGALERWFPKDDVGANGATNRWRSSVMIEYVLLQGINDTDEDAKRLAHMLQNVRAKVNLIQFNPHAGTIFAATSGDASARFRDMLMRSGQREVSLRVSRGDDENAACGQLAAGGSVDFAVPLSDVPARFQDAVVL